MRHLLYISVVILLAACKVGKPSGILSESKMERILYEYHLALATAKGTDSAEIKGRAYVLACLRHNGVSEAEFDSSLVWYYQHMEVLQKVYKRIGERLHTELGDVGQADNDVNRYSALSATGDTANVWNGHNYYLLSGNGFNNRITFEVNGDTTFKPNDQIMLNFRAQFVQKEGTRHAVAALAVQYEGDSVSHAERHVYGSGDISLTVETINRPIKRVYGYIYMISEWNINPRLLFIFSPSLVRMHREVKAETPAPLPQGEGKNQTSTDTAATTPLPAGEGLGAGSSLDPSQMHSRPMPKAAKSMMPKR